jgi:predicted PurR-regulated permease PerM
MVKNQKRIEQIAGISVIVAIVIGCGFVLKPFILPILWAAILCFATWPLYELLLKWFKGRKNLAAGLMTIMLLLVLFIPFFIVGLTFTENIQSAIEWINIQEKKSLQAYDSNTVDLKADSKITFVESLRTPPGWVNKIPWIGNKISKSWTDAAKDTEPVVKWLQPRLQSAGVWMLQHSLDVARGVFHLAMSVLIAFFFYRDGEGLVKRFRKGFQQISGDYAQHLIDVAQTTIRSVVYGVIGTALAQGLVAWVGFRIASVPTPVLLAVFTFFLSFIPFGPPIVWIGASIWIFANGHTGWGIFMLLYGFFGISSIDNLIKPLIISRGSKLSFIVMFIGVLGGVATFGFIGVFIGPTLLAVGFSLANEILIQHKPDALLK